MSNDLYRALHIHRDADSAAIKAAYKRAVFEYHPDRRPDDPAAVTYFRRVVQARDVLLDSDKRRRYDTFGIIAVDPSTQRVWQQHGVNPNGWLALTGEVREPQTEYVPPTEEHHAEPTTEPSPGFNWGTAAKAGAALGAGYLLWKRFAPLDESTRRHRGRDGKFRRGYFF